MKKDNSKLVALTGVAFVVLTLVGFAVSGDTADPTDDTAAQIVDFYVDNKDAVFLGALLQAIGAALLVFFAAHVRGVLRVAEGERGTLSLAFFGGAVILATGSAVDGTISITLVETADDIEPAAAQALSALYSNDYSPFAVGTGVLMLALGLSVVRHGALPAWLGWIAIALGVISLTPIGFVGAIGGALLVIVLSVMLAVRSQHPSGAGVE